MPPLSARSVIVQPRIVRQRAGGRPASQPVSRERSTPNASCCPMIHVSLAQPQPLQEYHAAYITVRVFYGPQLACVSRNICCVHNSIWHHRSRTLKETFHKTAARDETAHPPPISGAILCLRSIERVAPGCCQVSRDIKERLQCRISDYECQGSSPLGFCLASVCNSKGSLNAYISEDITAFIRRIAFLT